MQAARSSPSSCGDRSVETLIVVAPSSSRVRAVRVRAGQENRRLEHEGRRELAAPPHLAERPSAHRDRRRGTSGCRVRRRAAPPRPRRRSRRARARRRRPPRSPATDRPCPMPRAARGRARPRRLRPLRATPARGSPRRSASSRRFPARRAARAPSAARPPRARPRARAAPRRRGSRSGSAGRRRSAARSSARTLSPEGLEGVGVAREREHLAHEPVLDAEEEQLVELEAFGRAAARERGRGRPRGPRSRGRRSAPSCTSRRSPSAAWRGTGRSPRARGMCLPSLLDQGRTTPRPRRRARVARGLPSGRTRRRSAGRSLRSQLPARPSSQREMRPSTCRR